MRVVIYGINEQKKIQAIKSLRGATGMGLKDAKDVIDDVAAGNERKVELSSVSAGATLDEGYVRFRSALPEFKVDDFIEILGRFPPAMTAGDMLAVLKPVRDLQADPE